MSEAQDPRLDPLWKALSTVIDPEIGLDIVTLGLVYSVTIEGDIGHVTHTLTTPGCPMEHYITQGIHDAASFVDGLDHIETHLVWDPAWHSGMIAPGAF
ncbi:MAG TPA: metal-sulfur cluster assembly factor [Gemmatimonadaceae bacterium]|jgi:metal-sulfur cluster biosynthetic enzyme|nr:metal-sulfur cluster assembly factor [Gemmatimonadaceae bacterium]